MIGCATTKATRSTASRAVSSAEQQVKEAQAANASQHAPLEYQKAKETLDQARDSLNKRNYRKATSLANQATDLAGNAKATAVAKKQEGQRKPKPRR
ncbi:MAG: DUF4398 domain-containing protein [Elusimicrobia bacterium]|nr:DUF4398 domain-containing protein [Elusimicrobiota bacterium]